MKVAIDTSSLDRALKLYKQARKGKSYAYCVNRALQNVAGRAIGPTPKANPDKIAATMASVTWMDIAYYDRKGNYKRRKRPKRYSLYNSDSFAGRIINKRHKTKGEPLVWGDELQAEAKRMVAARIRAVNFIKSGWLPSYNKLSKLIDKPIRIKREGRIVGVEKGWAIPAPKGSAVTVGEIANNAQGAAKVATFAAEYAVNETARDMIGWATDRLREDARKSGLRVK